LNCTACGYDLRSLDASVGCPECGQPIAISEHDRTVARPQWLMTISGGAFLIGLGLLMGVTGIGLAALVGRVRSPVLLLLPIGMVISGSGRGASPPRRRASPDRTAAGARRCCASSALRPARSSFNSPR
jgi:hypothetical protein